MDLRMLKSSLPLPFKNELTKVCKCSIFPTPAIAAS
jgi:hypothetical protein